MIKLESLNFAYNGVLVVQDINTEFNNLNFNILRGPSGCGKTTLLRLIAGFLKPDSGKIEISNRIVTGPGIILPPYQRNIGYVFQTPALWPHMTVKENVSYGLSGCNKSERNEKYQKIVISTGIKSIENNFPDSISGGQARRVSLARTLVHSPRYLLLDEPLTNLDTKARKELIDIIITYAVTSDSTVLYVTHDQFDVECIIEIVPEAMPVRIVEMADGRLIDTALIKC